MIHLSRIVHHHKYTTFLFFTYTKLHRIETAFKYLDYPTSTLVPLLLPALSEKSYSLLKIDMQLLKLLLKIYSYWFCRLQSYWFIQILCHEKSQWLLY